MDDWEPIKRGEPEVRGVNPQYAGLLDVAVPLNRTPEKDWADFFRSPTGVPFSLSMHPPTIQGQTIYLRPPDGEVKKYMAQADAVIEAANQHYETRVLPKLRAAEQEVTRIQEETARRVERARRDLEGS